MQEEYLQLVSAEFWPVQLLRPALFYEQPIRSDLLQNYGNSTSQCRSLAERVAENGICIQRHAGGKCNTPINTCLWHLRSGRTLTSQSSTVVPEAKTKEDVVTKNKLDGKFDKTTNGHRHKRKVTYLPLRWDSKSSSNTRSSLGTWQ